MDFSFLYYKYYFQLESGRMRRLTAPIEWGGLTMERDISEIYYSIREIEGFRKQLEQAGHEVIMSICFDMPSDRSKITDSDGDTTSEAKNYKANRVKRLSDDDFKNMKYIEMLLSDAGYNTYRIDGYEADDIVNHLVNTEKSNFDYSVIYTPDSDLLVNIDEKVGACRYKSGKGYTNVDIGNFSSYLGKEFKVEELPFNSLMLFKCTVGDKSDNISGINKFGPKSFDKLITFTKGLEVDWEYGGNYLYNLELLEMCKGYLSDVQFDQAITSLSMIRPMKFEDGIVEKPIKVTSQSLREDSYLRCGMRSLII